MTVSLSTPCLLVDKKRLIGNIEKMQQKAKTLGGKLRPHIKTAKSPEIADMFDKDICNGLTVSTLKEAEYFVAHGYLDIIYAVTISPNKIGRALSLIDKSPEVKLLVDCVEVAKKLNKAAEINGTTVKVLIEIDVDGHRAGIEPQSPELLELAQYVSALPSLEFVGLLTHAGASYNSSTADEARLYAIQEVQRMNQAVQSLEQNDIQCEIVSIGSTPTITELDNAPNITEFRAGVFVFQDLVMKNIGVCEIDNIAMGVLSTVISHKRSHNRVIIDAGGLALSKDRGTAIQRVDYGYGALVDPESYEPIDGLVVDSANQEHGIVQLKEESQFDKLPIGSKVLIFPNHACMTAAAYDGYFVKEPESADSRSTIQSKAEALFAKSSGFSYYTRINGW